MRNPVSDFLWLIDQPTEWGLRAPMGELAQRDIDPLALAPWYHDENDRLHINPLAIPARFHDNVATRTLAHANPFGVANVGFALAREALFDPIETIKRGPRQTLRNALHIPSAKLSDHLDDEDMERIREAPNRREAYNIATEGRPWARMAMEMLYAPENLAMGAGVGARAVGAGAKLSKLAQTSRAADRTLRAARVAEKGRVAWDKIQGAPIYLSARVLKGVAKRRGWLDPTRKTQGLRELGDVYKMLEEMENLGFDENVMFNLGSDRRHISFKINRGASAEADVAELLRNQSASRYQIRVDGDDLIIDMQLNPNAAQEMQATFGRLMEDVRDQADEPYRARRAGEVADWVDSLTRDDLPALPEPGTTARTPEASERAIPMGAPPQPGFQPMPMPEPGQAPTTIPTRVVGPSQSLIRRPAPVEPEVPQPRRQATAEELAADAALDAAHVPLETRLDIDRQPSPGPFPALPSRADLARMPREERRQVVREHFQRLREHRGVREATPADRLRARDKVNQERYLGEQNRIARETLDERRRFADIVDPVGGAPLVRHLPESGGRRNIVDRLEQNLIKRGVPREQAREQARQLQRDMSAKLTRAAEEARQSGELLPDETLQQLISIGEITPQRAHGFPVDIFDEALKVPEPLYAEQGYRPRTDRLGQARRLQPDLAPRMRTTKLDDNRELISFSRQAEPTAREAQHIDTATERIYDREHWRHVRDTEEQIALEREAMRRHSSDPTGDNIRQVSRQFEDTDAFFKEREGPQQRRAHTLTSERLPDDFEFQVDDDLIGKVQSRRAVTPQPQVQVQVLQSAERPNRYSAYLRVVGERPSTGKGGQTLKVPTARHFLAVDVGRDEAITAAREAIQKYDYVFPSGYAVSATESTAFDSGANLDLIFGRQARELRAMPQGRRYMDTGHPDSIPWQESAARGEPVNDFRVIADLDLVSDNFAPAGDLRAPKALNSKITETLKEDNFVVFERTGEDGAVARVIAIIDPTAKDPKRGWRSAVLVKGDQGFGIRYLNEPTTQRKAIVSARSQLGEAKGVWDNGSLEQVLDDGKRVRYDTLHDPDLEYLDDWFDPEDTYWWDRGDRHRENRGPLEPNEKTLPTGFEADLPNYDPEQAARAWRVRMSPLGGIFEDIREPLPKSPFHGRAGLSFMSPDDYWKVIRLPRITNLDVQRALDVDEKRAGHILNQMHKHRWLTKERGLRIYTPQTDDSKWLAPIGTDSVQEVSAAGQARRAAEAGRASARAANEETRRIYDTFNPRIEDQPLALPPGQVAEDLVEEVATTPLDTPTVPPRPLPEPPRRQGARPSVDPDFGAVSFEVGDQVLFDGAENLVQEATEQVTRKPWKEILYNPEEWFADTRPRSDYTVERVAGSGMSKYSHDVLKRTLDTKEYTNFAKLWDRRGKLRQEYQKQVDILNNTMKRMAERHEVPFEKVESMRIDDAYDFIKRHGTADEQEMTSRIFGALGWPEKLDQTHFMKRELGRAARKDIYQRYRIDLTRAQLIDKLGDRRWLETATDETVKELLNQIGATVDDGDRGAAYYYKTLMNAYREQALIDGRYHLANMTDMTMKMLLEGQWRGALMAPSVFYRTLKEGLDLPPELLSTGVRNVPTEIRSSYRRAAASTEFAEGHVDWRRVMQSAREGDWDSALRETQKSRGTTGLGQIPGAGAVGGPVADLNRSLSMAIETSFRYSSWYSLLDKARRDAIYPRFLEELERVAGVAELGDEATNAMVSAFKQRGYRLSTDEINSIVNQHAPGADDVSRHLSTWWTTETTAASRHASEQATRVHFPIGDQRVIEEKLKLEHILPFHVWATRNVPYYTQTLAHNPWLLRGVARYHTLSDREREEAGLTHRFKRKLPVGLDGPASFLLGQDATVWMNPTVAISLFDQSSPRFEGHDETFVDQILSLQDVFGLRVAPWFTLPLNVLGYTTDADPPRFSRHTRAVQAATGFDPGVITGEPVRRLRGRVSGKLPGSRELPGATLHGSSHMDYLVQREIINLSLENTGKPNDDAYMAAMADPSNPIHQEAKKRALRERRVMEAWNLASPIPMATVSDTEAGVRRDGRRAYQHIPDNREEARIRSGLALMARAEEEGRTVNKRQLYKKFPELRRFLEWRQVRATMGLSTDLEDYLYRG